MATQATLSDVIERLKAEGQLTRNTGTNSLKAVRVELSSQTNILKDMLAIMQAQEARFQLGRASQDNAPATTPRTPRADSPTKNDENRSSTSDILVALLALRSLGNLGKLAVVAIGGALGAVIADFKSIRTVFPKTMGRLVKDIGDLATNITERLTILSNAIKSGISTATTNITAAIVAFGSWIRGVFSTTGNAINSLGRSGKIFTGIITAVTGSISSITNTFLSVGKSATIAAKTAIDLGSAFSRLFSPIKSMLGAITATTKSAGKIFVPLNLIMVGIDTIRGAMEGFASGGTLGGIKGAILGFFNSLVSAPLDLVKNIVSWVAKKLGFENFSEFLDSFSFTELITTGVNAIFSFVDSAWEWVKEKLSNPVEKLKEMWKITTDGVSNMGSWMWEQVKGVWDWIVGVFGKLTEMLPSMEDLQKAILEQMPDWLRKLVGAPERAASQIVDEQLEANRAELAEAQARLAEGKYSRMNPLGPSQKDDEALVEKLQAVVEAPNPQIAVIQQKLATLAIERQALIDSVAGSGVEANTSFFDSEISKYQALMGSYRNGTKGFMDFGPGSLAMLHGIEAVVPRNTPAGEFLAQNFDDNFMPIMQRIASVESAAMTGNQTAPIIITNAPTVAPVNNNVTGPTNINNSRVTAIGNGSGGSGLGRFAN